MLKSNSTKVILAGASTIALLSSVSAHAQIDEIIVTAEKRAENVQDVSISVTALNEELLEFGGIDDVSRLEQLVPGVNFSFAGNDAKFNVRGANSSNTFGDNSSIVGAFVDGVYKSRASQQTRAFFDVKNVEFLRGPQGTLYGRNTFAGALNVYTNTPDHEEYSAGISTSIERFDRNRTEGYINIPLESMNAGIRVAGFYDKSDGYINNLAGPDLGANDDKGVRVTASFEPTDNLSAVLRYSNIKEDGNEAGLFGYTRLCRNETPEGLTDAFGSVRDCTNPVRGSGGLGPAANGPGGDPWEVSQDYVRPVKLKEEVLSAHIDYDFGGAILKSITSYTDYKNDIQFDFDFSPTPNSNGGYEEETSGFTQELQLISDTDSPLQYTVGAYYSDQEDRASFNIYQQTQRDDSTRGSVTIPAGTFTLLDGTDIVSGTTFLGGFFADNYRLNTKYFGIFGQLEYALNDQMRLIGGLRYNDESKDLDCAGSNFSGGDRVVNVAPNTAGTSPAVIPRGEDVFTFNCNAADAETNEESYDNVTWRVGGEYDISDDVMLYATASTGYLSGAVSRGGVTDEQESQVIELGFRSRLADNTVQLNGAVHFTEYTNLLTQLQREEGGIVVTFGANGGDIEAWGVEFDAIWQATDELTLTGNVAYLNSEFGTFGQTNPYQLYQGRVQGFVDQAGNTTPWSPELSFGATAAYTVDLGDKGTLTPYGQMYYSSSFNTSNLLANDPAQEQEAFTKFDARLIWDDASEKYSVEAFVENIGNTAVLARGNNNSDDVVQTSYLYPRNYGMKFSAKF